MCIYTYGISIVMHEIVFPAQVVLTRIEVIKPARPPSVPGNQILNSKTRTMKILRPYRIKRYMQVLAGFIPNRILSIGISVKSCDIYPHKRAILRFAKNNSPEKELAVRPCSSIVTGFLFASLYTDMSRRYAGNDQHFSVAILSLLKPGPDSYPVYFTIKLCST